MAASRSKESLPWADLPTEMADEVVGHLDIFSTAQFTSVCPSWAKAVTTNPTLPFGTPCLLMSLEDDEQAEAHPVDDDDDEEQERLTTFGLLELYSPWRETSTFPACIRAMRDRYWVGAKDDWLATVDESCNAELVNPYSGHRVHLPAITTIPGVELTGRVCGLRRCGTNGYDHVLRRIVVCETPSGSGEDDGYLVIGLFSSGLLAIARGGEHSWTALKNPREAWSSFDSYSDAIAHKGKVFAVGSNGYIYAWDLGAGTTCPEPVKLRPPQANHGIKCPQNLAESANGRRLLLVYTHDWRYKLNINLSGEIERCDEHGHGVHLYELDVDTAVPESDGDHGWSRVTSLGDRALFLGSNYAFLANVDRGSEDQLLRPNSVCFTMNELFGYLGMDFDKVVLDLDDQEHHRTKLFHSNRHYSFQSPIWFRPRVVARQRQSI